MSKVDVAVLADGTRILDASPLARSVSVRAAYAFRYWPPGEVCGAWDPYRKALCRRSASHTGWHSAVGCEEGC
jgi:hypothetical protein